jgi:hypothetical protein
MHGAMTAENHLRHSEEGGYCVGTINVDAEACREGQTLARSDSDALTNTFTVSYSKTDSSHTYSRCRLLCVEGDTPSKVPVEGDHRLYCTDLRIEG